MVLLCTSTLTLVRGEVLRQFDTLFVEVGSPISENLKFNILGLVMYFPTVSVL